MKIVCKKGSNAQQMLELVGNLIEKLSLEHPLLAQDMELDIDLTSRDGAPCAATRRISTPRTARNARCAR